MSLNDLESFEWPFYVKLSLLPTALSKLFYIATVEPIGRIFFLVSYDQGRCVEADCDRQIILGFAETLWIFRRRKVAGATS